MALAQQRTVGHQFEDLKNTLGASNLLDVFSQDHNDPTHGGAEVQCGSDGQNYGQAASRLLRNLSMHFWRRDVKYLLINKPQVETPKYNLKTSLNEKSVHLNW